jgi:multicomponent Na+:H+ antiporter subunit F
MSPWIVATIAVLFCLVPCLLRCVRGDALSRLVALEAGSIMTVMILLMLAEAYNRKPFVDLALTLALLSFGAGLVFARFLERWL